MFVEQLRRAVEATPRVELPAVSALLWKAFAAGQVTEAEASALSEAIELKRALPAAQKPIQRWLIGSRPGALLRSNGAVAGLPLGHCRRPWRAGSRQPRRPSWP